MYEPYRALDGVEFGSTEDEILRRLGEPSRIASNKSFPRELCYESATYRFDCRGFLKEFTLGVEEILFADATVRASELRKYIAEVDGDCFDRYGFMVSPLKGLAFDPEQLPWITFFAESELALWQALGK